jgi:transcription elongation factor SPT6
LIENFCTERDDEIRSKDVPERFFDMRTPFHGPNNLTDLSLPFTQAEEEEAAWIITRVPPVAAEYAEIDADYDMNMKIDSEGMQSIEKKQKQVLESIMFVLRYVHCDNLEPEFIRKYREDMVTSPAVRENLNAILDEDTEWERILNAKKKVKTLLAELVKIAESDDALGADEETVANLKNDLQLARKRLDDSVNDEERIKAEIADIDNNDDDDDLFEDDDDEDKVSRQVEIANWG